MSEKKELKQEELNHVSGGAGYDQSKYYLFKNHGLQTQMEFGPYSSIDEIEDKGFRDIKNSISGGINVANVVRLHNNEYSDCTARYYQLVKYL